MSTEANSRVRFTPDIPCPICGGNPSDVRGNGKQARDGACGPTSIKHADVR